ncbi:hypothetical protein [Caballeronia sp. dw_19]|uniref:hypothetical protein n=1 Tax=Caballeronia sp. dw_19 TaxID=2719791 RepID=UPI001BD3B7ED|nr:hypothetical protein [Caballeronia sp. dw_19]
METTIVKCDLEPVPWLFEASQKGYGEPMRAGVEWVNTINRRQAMYEHANMSSILISVHKQRGSSEPAVIAATRRVSNLGNSKDKH